MSDLSTVNKLLNEIEADIDFRDKLNPTISKADVAWHLYHSLKTINTICEALKASNPEDFKSTFGLPKIFVMTFGIIPRGKARAPKSVKPPENILTKNIKSQLELARENVSLIQGLDRKKNFYHPIFGYLNKNKTIRFLGIHTNHHLKIVRDILSK
ncbi:hypothetical protein [Urechidicola croceus]|uniref:DUF1569 domain-containing protein n=1 Tax=Urechidicola croceus TaxID=1850246 RepID=A0A1D8PA99_9FLAO|nr:hypothetical protein [Urechidicola croceus]AOW21509.1 hypothetical protein LPB138_12835 [Urechidicola croceus]